MNHLRKTASFLLALLILSSTNTVRAQDEVGFDRDLLKLQDQLQLKSGASLSGIVGVVPEDRSEPVSFESSEGDSMLIDRTLISKIEKADAVAQRYNDAVDRMKDNAQSHRDMITWCEEQERGRIRFKSQILFHRKRILLFEPDDRATRSKLGYKLLKDEDRWVNEDQFWAQQGYNSKKDSKLYVEMLDKLEANDELLNAKRKKFSRWQRNLRRMSQREAVDGLVAISDPQIMPEIYKKFSETKDKRVRAVYAEVFATARPTTSAAIKGLVTAVMDDRSDIALDYLQQDGFNRKQVAAELAKFLTSSDNRRIQRAGYALGELESTHAILALSQVLITRHQTSAATQNSGATRTQGNAGGESFQFGNKDATFADFPNEAVLNALKKITGQDFGYSEKAYQKWYVDTFTHVSLKARR